MLLTEHLQGGGNCDWRPYAWASIGEYHTYVYYINIVN